VIFEQHYCTFKFYITFKDYPRYVTGLEPFSLKLNAYHMQALIPFLLHPQTVAPTA